MTTDRLFYFLAMHGLFLWGIVKVFGRKKDDMRVSKAVPIKVVVIDGVEYIPRDTLMPDEALEFMSQLYGLIWIESCYDPYSEATRAFAEKCWPHINMLNQIFKFRK